MTLGVVFASCDALWQVFTGKDWVRGYAPVVFIGLVRARASFKDPGTFGVYLSAVSPLVFGLSLYYFQKKKKIIMAILSLVTLIGLVLPYSRPTLLAVYLALFFLSVIKKDKILVTILIILVLISPFLLPASVKKWARQVDYNPIRFMLNDDRIAIYQHSLNMIKEHPLIGLGANTYMKNYKKYKTYPEYRNVITSDFLYAHNNFLHMGAEIGLVGLTVFIWLLYTLFSGIRNIYKNLEDNYLKVCLLSLSACLLAFLVNGLAESSLYSARVAMIFWYLSGLSLAFKKFVYNADRP
jgi:O-antigen ligase